MMRSAYGFSVNTKNSIGTEPSQKTNGVECSLSLATFKIHRLFLPGSVTVYLYTVGDGIQ